MTQTEPKDTTARTEVAGLQVATVLHDFLADDVLPTVGVDADEFWNGFAEIVRDFTPRNKELLARRDELQAVTGSQRRTLASRSRAKMQRRCAATGRRVRLRR